MKYKKIFSFIYKAIVSNCIVFGTIFGNKPIVEKGPAEKNIESEK